MAVLALVLAAASGVHPAALAAAGAPGTLGSLAREGSGEEPDAKGLENPLPYSKATLAQGRKHYLRHCQICHGYDGRALENIDYEAADLTAPDMWRYGTSDGEIFVNTRDGAGDEMPPFRSQLKDKEIWQVVHYVRSLGPNDLKPPLAAAADEKE